MREDITSRQRGRKKNRENYMKELLSPSIRYITAPLLFLFTRPTMIYFLFAWRMWTLRLLALTLSWFLPCSPFFFRVSSSRQSRPVTHWAITKEISICNGYHAIYNHGYRGDEECNEVTEVISEYLRKIDQLVSRYKCLLPRAIYSKSRPHQ